jgi:hypothetical protein
MPGGVCTLVIILTVSGLKMRTPSNSPMLSIMRAKRAMSGAVVKRPACPATPPMKRAVGSCTVPRSMTPSVISVGAMRGILDGAEEIRCRSF